MSDAARLEALIAEIEDGELNVTGERFRQIVVDLKINLQAITKAVSDELSVRSRIAAKREIWQSNYQDLIRVLEPALADMRGDIDRLQTRVREREPDSPQRRRARETLRQRLRDYHAMRDLRVALAEINDARIETLGRTAPGRVARMDARLTLALDRADAALDSIGSVGRARIGRQLADIEEGTVIAGALNRVDPNAFLAARMAALQIVTAGPNSIPALHARRLRLETRARELLAQNQRLSRRLDAAVADAVRRTRAQIDETLATAERTRITGAAMIGGTVLLSIVCSYLIMRVYVGRHVVRRLAAVRDSMLALSRGELEHPLPSPGSDEIGRMTYALTVFRDNAVRLRQRTRELQIARDEAVQSSEAKTRFLANMSHELRTPLNAVIGFAEIIQNEAVGPIGERRYCEYAKDIHDSATHLLDVINDILDVAKAEAGKLDLADERVEIDPFVTKTLRLVETRAQQQGVTLTADLDSQVPVLIADPRRLRQILLNLLSNAIKFTGAGGTVRVETAQRADGGIDMAVTDTGVGMSDAEVETALAPFSQIENSFSRHAEGTGLGLPLTKHLVELHGGTFSLSSVKHAGTRITAVFPAERVYAASGGSAGAAFAMS
jgi:signal transduction histidine kinase